VWVCSGYNAGRNNSDTGVRRVKLFFFIMFGLVAASICGAATITEDFSADPLQNGWQIFGDTNLFQWDSTNQNLDVTWDSSQTNSYFYKPLGTILAKSDDFSLSFDLQLSDIAIGVNPAKTNTFELAIGFINFVNATNTSLERGTGRTSQGARNTCEFDYFPDSGHGATISPTIISSNNQFATTFAFPFALDPGALFHVTMNYTATNQTLHTTMTRNSAPFAVGAIPDVLLGSSFSDFRLDQFAIINWSDAGADGSLLAHGTVDNFVVTVPPPPIQNLTGAFSNNVWQAQFISQSNWLYTLQQTADFVSWNDVSIPTGGNGTNLFLPDTNAISGKSFYRVRADRP
jgi:hypothetical protein